MPLFSYLIYKYQIYMNQEVNLQLKLLSLSYHLGCGVYTGSRCYLLQQRRDREAGDALTFAYVAPRADWLTAANLTVDTRRMT